ncbi:MAG TPA: hypothetical protein VFW52_02775 [Candidatus Saccharimonadales bacterium]|nr:hypothetical protein [Candidatus Saccharimonadales bacterium]
MSKFESMLKDFSEEQIMQLAQEARQIRANGEVVPEGVFALSLSWVIRENNGLRKANEKILDELLPVEQPAINGQAEYADIREEETA